MKSLSARELILLSSPLLIVAVAGFLLSRRKPPTPNTDKLRLEFHIDKPTTLEAFNGVDAALVVELKGPNTESGPGKNQLRVWESDPLLEVQTSRGVQSSHWRRPVGIWRGVWKGNLNGTRLRINSRAIPPGKVRLQMSTVLSPISSAPPARPLRVAGAWTVNRALIKPFNFAAMARVPLVRLTAVKIIQVKANGNIRGEAVFDLTGTTMNSETPFGYDFKETSGGMSSGFGNSDLTPETATRRVREWTVYRQPGVSNGHKEIVHVTGHVSAGERWPLAFKFEPFDFAKAKAGQKLNFKSWPATTPISN